MAADRNARATPGQAELADVAKVEAVVVRGTVHTEQGPVGPGGTATVTVADFNRLVEFGIFKPEGAVDAPVVQDGKLQVTAQAGANVTVL